MSDFKSIADVPEMLELWDFDKNPENPKTVSSALLKKFSKRSKQILFRSKTQPKCCYP